MSKTLYEPDRKWWYTTDIAEWGDVGKSLCGGYSTFSTGRKEPPIIATYVFMGNGVSKGCIYVLNIDGYTLENVVYDQDTVKDTISEMDVLYRANEYQGDERDMLDHLYHSTNVSDLGEYVVWSDKFPCKVDDHDTAIQYMHERVREYVKKNT